MKLWIARASSPWAVKKMRIYRSWFLVALNIFCKWYRFFFQRHSSVDATLVSFIFYVMACILTFGLFQPLYCGGMESASYIQSVSTEQKLKCDTNVKILYRNSFHPPCYSDVLTNLPNSVDAFYTILWLEIVFVRKK